MCRMVVRIRFSKGPVVKRDRKRNRHAALALAALLDPAAVIVLVIGLWRVAAELNWVGSFAISTGFFSHWEPWLAAASGLELCALALNRYGRGGGASAV
jgi:hypothetical protein